MTHVVGWGAQRVEWNAAGQCARKACRGDISEMRYWNTGSRLYYCWGCARRINAAHATPICWRDLQPGRYRDLDGVEGDLLEFDHSRGSYTFRLGGDAPCRSYGREEALKLSYIGSSLVVRGESAGGYAEEVEAHRDAETPGLLAGFDPWGTGGVDNEGACSDCNGIAPRDSHTCRRCKARRKEEKHNAKLQDK